MKGSVGTSMNGSIEYVRAKKKKTSKKNCKKCQHFIEGYCKKHNMRPSTIDLGANCTSYIKRIFKK